MNKFTRKKYSFGYQPFGRLTEFYVLLMILLASTQLRAQENLQLAVDSIYYSEQEEKVKIQSVVELINRQDTASYTPELGHAYHRLGVLYRTVEQYEQAILVGMKAVEIRSSLNSIDTVKLNNSLYNISVYYKNLGEIAAREKYLNKILDHHSEDKFYYRAFNQLATIKSDRGDYFEALENLKTTINTVKDERYWSHAITAHKQSIQIYSDLSNPRKFLSIIHEHEKQLDLFEVSEDEMVNVNTNLGIIYSKINDSDRAIEHYLKALPVYIFNEDSTNIGNVYNNLGAQYSQLNLHQKAASYYKQALLFGNQDLRAKVYNNQGFYLQTPDLEQKLKLYQKAINTTLGQEYKRIEIYALPDVSALDESVNRLDVLSFLIDMAAVWVELFEQENDHQYLEQAKKTLYAIDQLVSDVRLDSNHEKSKLFWISNGVDFYVLAVKVCFSLDQPEEAFYFMEKNKSLLLLENLEKNGNANTESLDILSLEEAIEKHVSDQSNFVEYILNDKQGFGLFCSEKDTYLFELKNVPDLISKVDVLKEMVKRPFESKNEFDLFDDLSFDLFLSLFSFRDATALISNRKLTVIPDYVLHNLPFELLVTQKQINSFQKNYLIKTTETSYLHSCSVDQQIGTTLFDNEEEMIGFVPTIFQNDTLSDLHMTEVEMKKIASFFPSKLILREQATKQVFIESLDQYNIIHINSHAGYTKNQTPWLSFYDQKVDLEELTTYNNHSNLVILDACKSALGEQELGEGIRSISRAFFYSGTSSVIAAQWQVNEQSSAAIFNHFYKNLNSGASKSEALHQAKLSYLESSQLTQLSPYYWAAFTLTGDAEHVLIPQKGYWVKVVMAVLLVFSLLFFVIKVFK